MKLFFFFLILSITLPGLAQEDDEIEKLQAAKQKQLETMLAIVLQHSRPEQISTLPPEIQKLGYKELDFKALTDERVIKHLKKIFESSPLIQMKESEVQELLLEKLKGSFIEGVLRNNPKVLACLIDILRSKTAMADLLGIFLRQEDLMLYFFVWLGFMLMGWVLKKIVLNEEMNRFKRQTLGLIIGLSMTSLSLYSFYKIFEQELGSMTHIVSEHWENRHS